jgi:hypothetical protein
MRFHRNISLLRLRVAMSIASIVAMTFWWGTTTLAAPRRHPSITWQHLGTGGGWGTTRGERVQRGMECGTAMEGIVWDGVRGGEDNSSERTLQQRAMGEHGRW